MTQAHGPHSLQALQARYGERHRWLLLLSVMLGSLAAVMSSTILNVAIPDMSTHFTLGQSRVQWVTSGFMVAMTASAFSCQQHMRVCPSSWGAGSHPRLSICRPAVTGETETR